MINKELKKLSRRELVDVIYQLKKNEQDMQEQISALEKGLEDKRIQVSSSGSIADAAVRITNIFSTAQMTADLYLREISCLKEEAEKESAKIIADAEEQAKSILSEAKKQHDNLSTRYQNDYKKWQQLQIEIQKLKEQKANALTEDK